MPIRKPILANNEIYHVFNRSVGNEEILTLKRNLGLAVELLDYYHLPQTIRYSKFKVLPKQQKNDYLTSMNTRIPLVRIYAFSLMPNHYHLLLKQLQDRGISQFISNFQNSFAKFFNIKNERHGSLFQNPFKAKHVETDEEFTHISRYIHLNPVTSFLVEIDKLTSYPWTSFPCYKGEIDYNFIDTDVLIKMFGSGNKYLQFVTDQAGYQRKLGLIKRLIIE